MKTAVIALTRGGREMAGRIVAGLENCELYEITGGIVSTIQKIWSHYDGLICVMATGIVVRAIVPLCRDKKTDPCVLVLDEKGQFVISLLSGHLGGGNGLAHKVAAITGGTAVITTASDVTGHTALDLWATENDLRVQNPQRLTGFSAKLVNEGGVSFFSTLECGSLPADFKVVTEPALADIILSHGTFDPLEHPEALVLCPCNLYLGLGCNRGASATDFERAVTELCARYRLERSAIAGIASIDLKADEAGLLQFARENNLPIRFYTKDELNQVEGISTSSAVMAATGAKGVAEPAAMLAAGDGTTPGQLLVRKIKWKDVTAAVAEKKLTDMAKTTVSKA
ncbi:MAG: cobalt-precorrin 5A hydrolase [Proteobacteria bacterium]|nr:cobalt-precorrin 5A hydrolase [Pseudomonadota bacterium]MBU4328594.1 cobalt-precorrin 5A hydrolase [Pseudomonadota bacterium]